MPKTNKNTGKTGHYGPLLMEEVPEDKSWKVSGPEWAVRSIKQAWSITVTAGVAHAVIGPKKAYQAWPDIRAMAARAKRCESLVLPEIEGLTITCLEEGLIEINGPRIEDFRKPARLKSTAESQHRKRNGLNLAVYIHPDQAKIVFKNLLAVADILAGKAAQGSKMGESVMLLDGSGIGSALADISEPEDDLVFEAMEAMLASQ